jgi:rod shape-determining protein MreC
VIVFRNNSFQQSAYLNSSRSIAGSFYAKKENLVGFMKLSTVNDSLMRENARLRKQLGMPVETNPLPDSSYTRVVHRDSVSQRIHYTYVPAKVINNSVDLKVNYITLDAGSKQGIKRKMAVISPNGIVGRISHVSENYSVALSFLSDRFYVSAMVADGSVGKLSWDGGDADFGILSGISQSVRLKLGDSVFTSGYGDFPERIFVGRAAQVLSGTSYKIYLSTKFRKLRYVYIITEEVNFERSTLEDSVRINP